MTETELKEFEADGEAEFARKRLERVTSLTEKFALALASNPAIMHTSGSSPSTGLMFIAREPADRFIATYG